ncbi:hypothetical protein V3C99_014780 [Haemonchus contortus]|uniref:Uncharacterized protein n=1 Tax=Haemonchus contortus TaxID=6289 RepID=A0A7I4YU85_HAECO
MTVRPGSLQTASIGLHTITTTAANEMIRRFHESSERKECFSSLKLGRSTGPLWLVIGTTADVIGTCSRKSMTNVKTDDTGDILLDKCDEMASRALSHSRSWDRI